MRATLSKTVFTILVVVLLILGAIAGYAWWRLNHHDAGYDAQHNAAVELKTLQESLDGSDLPAQSKEALGHDISDQLEALNRTAVEEARADHDAEKLTTSSAAARLDGSAKKLYVLSGTQGIDPDEQATLVSMAVSHWASARQLDGTLQQVADPKSAGSQSLASMTGLSRGDTFDASGLCPAASGDAKASPSGASSNQGSASKDPDAEDSDGLSAVLTGLYRSTWAESYYQARSDVDHLPEDTTAYLGGSAAVHDAQLGQLRADLGRHCSTIPQPQAAYSVSGTEETDPSSVLSDQAKHLAQQSLSVVRSEPAASGDATGARSWRAWGANSLALNTALAAQVDADVPALPGT
ncbi:hypothetical protein [Kocuria massiliensis]|uniref:hypothetical protein n=1 Tax=Kocuria massiliensis TaxID=1926282 RepID=UPI0022B9D396|nr:hypothetical protein [Kocuria massiliensis]